MQTNEQETKDMLKSVYDKYLKERVRFALPSASTLKSAMARAKLKRIPNAPLSLKNIDWNRLNKSF